MYDECPLCAKTGHPLQFCPRRDEFPTFVQEHSHRMCFSNQGPLQPLPNTYNPTWRNSDHGSWNNIEAPNQAFAPPSQQESIDTTLEDTLKLLAQSTLQFQQSTSSMIQEHSTALTKLGIQLEQIVQALNEHQSGGDDQEEKEDDVKIVKHSN